MCVQIVEKYSETKEHKDVYSRPSFKNIVKINSASTENTGENLSNTN